MQRRTFLRHGGVAAAGLALAPHLDALSPWSPGAAVRIGLVGVGSQGRAILTELAKFENVDVVAVCDTNSRRARAGVRRTENAKAYGTVDEMTTAHPDLDAVIVATSTHRHREVVVPLLAAGKHVFCEAPLASSVDDLKAIQAAADAAKGVFHVGHPARSNPVYDLARSFFLSGVIGDVVSIRAQYHKKTSWRLPATGGDDRESNWRLYAATSSGLAGEQGSHLFDVADWFLNRDSRAEGANVPSTVRGRGAVLAWKDGREIPDTVQASLTYREGLELHFDATLGNSFEGEHVTIYGTFGAIKLAGTHGWLFKEADAKTYGWEVYANRQYFHNEAGITLIADATKLAKQGKLQEGVGLPNPPLYYSLESFLKSATEGKEVTCAAREGVRAARIAIAAHEAVMAAGERSIELG